MSNINRSTNKKNFLSNISLIVFIYNHIEVAYIDILI